MTSNDNNFNECIQLLYLSYKKKMLHDINYCKLMNVKKYQCKKKKKNLPTLAIYKLLTLFFIILKLSVLLIYKAMPLLL